MFFQFFAIWANLGQLSPSSCYKACKNTLLGTFEMPAAGCSKNGLLSWDLNPGPSCQSKKEKKYLNAKSTEPPGHLISEHGFLLEYISILYFTWISWELSHFGIKNAKIPFFKQNSRLIQFCSINNVSIHHLIAMWYARLVPELLGIWLQIWTLWNGGLSITFPCALVLWKSSFIS